MFVELFGGGKRTSLSPTKRTRSKAASTSSPSRPANAHHHLSCSPAATHMTAVALLFLDLHGQAVAVLRSMKWTPLDESNINRFIKILDGSWSSRSSSSSRTTSARSPAPTRSLRRDHGGARRFEARRREIQHPREERQRTQRLPSRRAQQQRAAARPGASPKLSARARLTCTAEHVESLRRRRLHSSFQQQHLNRRGARFASDAGGTRAVGVF